MYISYFLFFLAVLIYSLFKRIQRSACRATQSMNCIPSKSIYYCRHEFHCFLMQIILSKSFYDKFMCSNLPVSDSLLHFANKTVKIRIAFNLPNLVSWGYEGYLKDINNSVQQYLTRQRLQLLLSKFL